MSSGAFQSLFQLLRSKQHRPAAASQQQLEALIDLLVWTMFVDRHIAAPEQGFIREQTADLPWDGVRTVGLYVDASVRRVRDVLGSERAEGAYLEDILARLGDAAARQSALAACERLAEVDGHVAPAEVAHLERVRAEIEHATN